MASIIEQGMQGSLIDQGMKGSLINQGMEGSLIDTGIDASKQMWAKDRMFTPGLVDSKGRYVKGSYEDMKSLPGMETVSGKRRRRSSVPGGLLQNATMVPVKRSESTPSRSMSEILAPSPPPENEPEIWGQIDQEDEELETHAQGGHLPLYPESAVSVHLVGEEGPELLYPDAKRGGYNVLPAPQTKEVLKQLPSKQIPNSPKKGARIKMKAHASGGYIEDWMKQRYGDPNQPLVNTNVPAMPGPGNMGAAPEARLQQGYGSANQPLINTAGLRTDGTVETVPNPRPMTDQRNIPGGTMPTPGTVGAADILGPRAKPGAPIVPNLNAFRYVGQQVSNALGPRAREGGPIVPNLALPREAARRLVGNADLTPDLRSLGVQGNDAQSQYNPQVVNQPTLWQRLPAPPDVNLQTVSPDPLASAPIGSMPKPQARPAPVGRSAQTVAPPASRTLPVSRVSNTVTPSMGTPLAGQVAPNPKELSGAANTAGAKASAQAGTSGQRPIEIIRGTQRSYINPETYGPGGFFKNPSEYRLPSEAAKGMTLGEEFARQKLSNAVTQKDIEGQYRVLEEMAKPRPPFAAQPDDILFDPRTQKPLGRAEDLVSATPPVSPEATNAIAEIGAASGPDRVRKLASLPPAMQDIVWGNLDKNTKAEMYVQYKKLQETSKK